MERKGFTTVDELRGLLSVRPGADESAGERVGYVSAMRDANSEVYGPW